MKPEFLEAPEYIKQAQQYAAVDDGAAPSLNFLTITTNKQFVQHNGSEKKYLGDHVDIIILAIAPSPKNVNRRAFWLVDLKDTESYTKPDCESPDGDKPYPWIEHPQSASCNNCKWAIAGTGFGKSSKCKSQKMVFFLYANDLDAGINVFRVSPGSLRPLADYRWDMANAQYPIFGGIKTTLLFDPDPTREYARVIFKFGGFVDQRSIGYTIELAKSAEIKNLQIASSTSYADVPQIEQQQDTVPGQGIQNIPEYPGQTPTVTPGPPTIPVPAPAPQAPAPTVSAQVTQPTPNADPMGDFLTDLFQTKPVSPFDSFIEGLRACTGIDGTRDYLLNNKTKIGEFSPPEKERIRQLATDKIAALTVGANTSVGDGVSPPSAVKTEVPQGQPPVSPTPAPPINTEDLIKTITTKEALPGLLEHIRKNHPNNLDEYLPAFIERANALNGVTWHPDFHGTSKDGYPSLSKSGNFTQRRGGVKQPNPTMPKTAQPVTQGDTTYHPDPTNFGLPSSPGPGSQAQIPPTPTVPPAPSSPPASQPAPAPGGDAIAADILDALEKI